MGRVSKSLETLEKRVIKNEEHSRQRNLLIRNVSYPVQKTEEHETKEHLIQAVKEILKEGVKLPQEIIDELRVDQIHRMFKAKHIIVVALVQRIHVDKVMQFKKNLAQYKCPFGSRDDGMISILRDKPPEKAKEVKAAVDVLKKLKAKFPNAKIVKDVAIALDSTSRPKHYSVLKHLCD